MVKSTKNIGNLTHDIRIKLTRLETSIFTSRDQSKEAPKRRSCCNMVPPYLSFQFQTFATK